MDIPSHFHAPTLEKDLPPATDWSAHLSGNNAAREIVYSDKLNLDPNWVASREASTVNDIVPDSNDYFVDPAIKASRLNRVHRMARIVYLLSSTNRMVPGL